MRTCLRIGTRQGGGGSASTGQVKRGCLVASILGNRIISCTSCDLMHVRRTGQVAVRRPPGFPIRSPRGGDPLESPRAATPAVKPDACPPHSGDAPGRPMAILNGPAPRTSRGPSRRCWRAASIGLAVSMRRPSCRPRTPSQTSTRRSPPPRPFAAIKAHPCFHALLTGIHFLSLRPDSFTRGVRDRSDPWRCSGRSCRRGGVSGISGPHAAPDAGAGWGCCGR